MRVENNSNQTLFGMKDVIAFGPKRFQRKIDGMRSDILQVGGPYACVVTKTGWLGKIALSVLKTNKEGYFIVKVVEGRVFSRNKLFKMMREASYELDRAVNCDSEFNVTLSRNKKPLKSKKPKKPNHLFVVSGG